MPTLRSWLAESPFTLALSSGFFGFYAHCGFVIALYEEGFRPQRITGASAGAIVGAVLASGKTPEELRDILLPLRRRDFWEPAWGTGFLSTRKLETIAHQHLVPTFQDAVIPFEAVVFDILSLRTRLLNEGSLARAVAASCAIPFFFHSVRIGKRHFWDGGVRHKSAVSPINEHERILCHYLHSTGIYSAYETKSDLKLLNRNHKTVMFEGLPKMHFNNMENAGLAIEAAYQRTKKALDLPIQAD